MHVLSVLRAFRVLPNLHVDDLVSAKDFYAGFLGLSDELATSVGWRGMRHRTARVRLSS